ncbi:hypothetical protein NX059_001619 [Plenodomus lindquistii]|nr:hypothetical protein NX059_001619 [Plenodomus lindquistii]
MAQFFGNRGNTSNNDASGYSSEDSDTETVEPDMKDNLVFSQQPLDEDGIPNRSYRNPAPIDFDTDTETEAESLSSSPAPSSPTLTGTVLIGRPLRRARIPSPENSGSPPHRRTKVGRQERDNKDPLSFFRLPEKIRVRIYALAAPPRARVIELHDYNTNDFTPRIQYYPPLAALFSVCYESRQELKQNEGGEIVHFTGDPCFGDGAVRGGTLYISFTKDTVFLGTRSTAACDTTETSRMAMLKQILKPIYLARIERLLVTYSGRDSYDKIGILFAPLKKLRIFYIGMQDEYSSRM